MKKKKITSTIYINDKKADEMTEEELKEAYIRINDIAVQGFGYKRKDETA
mgnify:CR=1 FL=1